MSSVELNDINVENGAEPVVDVDDSSFDVQDDKFAARYHYVMVFPLEEDGSQIPSCKVACKLFVEKGFEIFTYLSVQGDEFYCLITCSEQHLKDFADQIDFELELDPAYAEELMEAGDPEAKIAPVRISHMPEVTHLTPYSYIYGKYESDCPARLYALRGDKPGELFSEATTLKLIYEKLTGPVRLGGCGYPIEKLIKHGRILAFYPMHHKERAQKLNAAMSAWDVFPWTQPVNDIRAYFGEKVALYYCFLGNYSYFLIFPSILGFIIQMIVWGSGNINSPALPFFALFICVWSILMLENWKRQEKRISLRWGMENFEEKELDRPTYNGDIIRSFIDGSETKFYPADLRSKKLFLSFGLVGALVLLVIGTVTGIYILRFQLQSTTSLPASLIASCLNTLQITLFNMGYSVLSVKLTKFENHRTDTDYEDSMITKLFAFQFINSYSSFFFLAFVASYMAKADTDDDASADYRGQCGASSCMIPLGINLAIIFGSRITVTNALEVLLPYYNYITTREKETEGVTKRLTKPEEDYMLNKYDNMEESINLYADTAIQYGFMTLFITALPIACCFALITNHVKCKMNAWKLFTFYRRPIPQGTEDIGNWQGIFDFISTFGVLTNGAIICFTMKAFHYTHFGKAWVFIGFQWGMLSLQYIIGALIPDTPSDVVIQLERTQFIVSKLIDKTSDENYDPNKDLDAPLGAASQEDELQTLLYKMKGNSNEKLPDFPVHTYPDLSMDASQWPESIKLMK